MKIQYITPSASIIFVVARNSFLSATINGPVVEDAGAEDEDW